MSCELRYIGQILNWTYTIVYAIYMVYLIDFILAGSGSKCDPNRPAIEVSVILLILPITMIPILFFNWRGFNQKNDYYSRWYGDALKVRLFACVLMLLIGLIFGIGYITIKSW